MTQRQKDQISASSTGHKRPPEYGRKVSERVTGEGHPSAKIGEADVIEIRRRCANGEFQRDVGADYGISQGQVHRIVTGARWGHVKEGLSDQHS